MPKMSCLKLENRYYTKIDLLISKLVFNYNDLLTQDYSIQHFICAPWRKIKLIKRETHMYISKTWFKKLIYAFALILIIPISHYFARKRCKRVGLNSAMLSSNNQETDPESSSAWDLILLILVKKIQKTKFCAILNFPLPVVGLKVHTI